MSRKQLIRTAAAVCGGMAIGLAILAGLVALNSGHGFADCTATTAVGWIMPLLAGLVVGGVAWLLLAEEDSLPSDEIPLSSPCAGCGRPVARDWRLCPYCGAMTAGTAHAPTPPPIGEPPP